MANIFERAWGNYTALFEFLTKSEFDEAKGLIQPYNFATLYSYDLKAPNYNLFLLLNASNYVGSGTPTDDNKEHVAEKGNLSRIQRLLDAYEVFLSRLDEIIAKAIDPSDKTEYKDMQDKVDKARDSLEDYETVIEGKWQLYLDRNPNIPMDELPARRVIWERDNGYSMELERKRNLVRAANVKLNGWLRAQLPPEYSKIVDARRYFDDPNYWVDLPIAVQFDNNTMHHMWRKFPAQFPLISLDEFLGNDNKVERTFTSEEEHYKRVEEKWRVSVKARWGIFSGGGSAERREMEEVSKKSSFSITIGFRRFDEVEIFRDGWYQDALFETLGATMPEFWGPTGVLSCIPVSLIMARGTRIEVSVSEEYRRTLERFFATGGSVSFGPFFSGGGNYSKDERYMDYQKTTDGFVLSDSDKTIRILGARVKRYHWSDQNANNYRKGISKQDGEDFINFLSRKSP
ncbi:hypothetical protein [Aeromonas veronii]|uniref:hypothetical protein n=1 Tax=Aeromonas veronii TaxID=654 RepID=UPI003BA1FB90